MTHDIYTCISMSRNIEKKKKKCMTLMNIKCFSCIQSPKKKKKNYMNIN